MIPEQGKAAPERASIQRHAAHMDGMTQHFREELRILIRHYRSWRTEKDLCVLQELYLDAEGKALRKHLSDMYGLYRQAHMDYLALCRVHGAECVNEKSKQCGETE